MTIWCCTRTATRQEVEETPAEPTPVMNSVLSDTRVTHSSKENVRCITIPTHREFRTFGESVIPAPEFVRSMQSAGVGGGAPCSDSTKFNIILDNITDTTGQMLRLHEPINDPK